MEDYGNAMETYFKAYLIRKKAFGDEHPATLLSYECYSRAIMQAKGGSPAASLGN